MSEKIRYREKCPICGGKLETSLTPNLDKPIHDADKLVVQWGFKFFPHIDIDYRCTKCNYYQHVTLRDRKSVTASGKQGSKTLKPNSI